MSDESHLTHEGVSCEEAHLTHPGVSCEVDQLSSLTEVDDGVTQEEEEDINGQVQIKVEDTFDIQVMGQLCRTSRSVYVVIDTYWSLNQ